MIRNFSNITNEPVQRHTVVFNDVEATVLLRFSPQVQQWFIDCEVGNKSAFGVKLSLGTFHMVSRNMPIDFVVSDNSGNGIDPFKANDFSDGRCSLFIIDDEGIAEIRGQEVQI
jgi:hypothetical protein